MWQPVGSMASGRLFFVGGPRKVPGKNVGLPFQPGRKAGQPEGRPAKQRFGTHFPTGFRRYENHIVKPMAAPPTIFPSVTGIMFPTR